MSDTHIDALSWDDKMITCLPGWAQAGSGVDVVAAGLTDQPP